jgi:hypothetical protein
MHIVKMPKSCSDVTDAQVHRHTGLDWRKDPRVKEHRGSPAAARVLNRTDRDTESVNGTYNSLFWHPFPSSSVMHKVRHGF